MLATERQTAKLLIQNPDLFPDAWDGLTTADFTHPAYAAVFAAVEKAAVELGGARVTADTEWVHRVSEACEADEIRSLVASLAVEPLPVHGEVTVRYVIATSAALQLLTVMRTIAALKSKLQRTNPVEEQHKYNQMFSRAGGAGGTSQGAAHPQHRRRRLTSPGTSRTSRVATTT